MHTAKEEAIQYNVYQNFDISKNKKLLNNYPLSKLHSYPITSFDGINKLCDYIITCVTNDEINGDYYEDTNNIKIVEAGHILYSAGGNHLMLHVLMNIVPKRYRREMDVKWDKIGDWRG